MRATALACANIALAKYWGKSDRAHNLPAVPSVSLTLDALVTETVVELMPESRVDEVSLDGALREGDEARKIVSVLERFRARAGRRERARVVSVNRFPTASGLASSASGFAALAGAAAGAYGLSVTDEELSAEARRGSASAARSVFGGWVELPAGTVGEESLSARCLFGPEYWDVTLVVAVVTRAQKSVGSRDAMVHTAQTSPYWAAWLGCSPGYARQVRDGISRRDLEAVGRAMEASTMAMHACAWAAVPAVRYVRGVTVDVLDTVMALRTAGVGAWATMDAGPHVKVLCLAEDSQRVTEALSAVPGVIDTLIARPGPGVRVTVEPR